jgi:RNA polymerase sigma factor, sigma-70 family
MEEPQTGSQLVPGSLEELYVRHAPEAIRLAYLMTSDSELSKDMVQEAFIRVAGRFGHMREARSFDAYLRRTVVNLCLSHHRRTKIERRFLQREGALVGDGGRPVAAPDLGDRDELAGALRTLPERQRAAIVLRYYQDLPEHEVATTLGCSVGAARALVARGMETLRQQITKESGDHP